MAFFEDLGKTLSDTGKKVTSKAKELTETIQLKTQITSEKAKLDSAYAEIGKAYYEAHPLEKEETYKTAYEAVRASREKIAALEIELSQAEGVRTCAECGSKIQKDGVFCSQCGAATQPDTTTQAEEYKDLDEVAVVIEDRIEADEK